MNNTTTTNSNSLDINNDNDPIVSPVSLFTDSLLPASSSSTALLIGTLNCRGLTKTAFPSTRKQFIQYLCTRPLQLLALQETHAATTDIQDMFHTQF